MSSKPIRFKEGRLPLTEKEKEDEVDFGVVAMNSILEAIRVEDNEEIVKYLETINIVQLSAIEQLTIIDALVAQAYDVDNKNAVGIIFDHFDERMGGITKLKTFCLYLMRGGLDDHILAFLGSSFTNDKSSFESLIHDLNSGESSPEIFEACLNAERVFGELDKETLEKIKVYICMDPLARNYYIDKYISVKLGDMIVVEAPDWVINKVGEIVSHDNLDIPDYPKIKLRSPNKYAKEYIRIMREENEGLDLESKIDNDFTYQTVATLYAMMPLEEKVTMINRVLNIQEKKLIKLSDKNAVADGVLHLIYGPNNTPHDQVISDNYEESPCLRYGGCRMLLCMCGETDEDDDYIEDISEKDDWFKGRCNVCSRRIERRHYALRRPLSLGGWRGCYCSFECLNGDIKDPQDLLSPILVSALTELLYDIGIQERTYTDAYQVIN